MLVVDSREPAPLVEIIKLAVPDLSRALLETADFVIFDTDGCAIGIERKTITDFLGSFGTGRLVKQLNRMRSAFVPILLLEGQFALTDNMRVRVNTRDTGWHHSAVQMALLAVQREGVTVLWTPDHRGTADTLRILEHRASKGCAMIGQHSLLDVWPQGKEDTLVRQRKARQRKDKPISEVPPERAL